MTKYVLKKDTPEFKAGSVFTRRKYDYGDYDDDLLFADISPGTSPVPAFDISLIDDFDEWFEDLGSQKWTQKQIKQIEFGESMVEKLEATDKKYHMVDYSQPFGGEDNNEN